MNPCWKRQKKPFEVQCAASGEQDYTSKPSAGQSCFTGQCTNWAICQHLRVMGLSHESDRLTLMLVLSCLTPCNQSKRRWRWCLGAGFSNARESRVVGNQQSIRRRRLFVHLTGWNVQRRRQKRSCSENRKRLKVRESLRALRHIAVYNC